MNPRPLPPFCCLRTYIYMCNVGGPPTGPTEADPVGGTDAGVAPTRKTPIVVWRATITRLSGERVRPVCGLCGVVCVSRASHWSRHPHPTRSRSAHPRPTSHCVTYLHHMPPLAGAQRLPGERRPAGPGPHAARCGTALQSNSKRESEPVDVFLIPLVIETTPYRTHTGTLFSAPHIQQPAACHPGRRPNACFFCPRATTST